jgi:hypothetical protein
MLRVERELGIRATYAVVGAILPEMRDRIEADGHCVAFHSWDHHIGPDQLDKCRSFDYRIKGYRPPQSVITAELSDANLLFHNFEWLANSAYMWGFNEPRLENRLAKLPIHFDDFSMYHDGVSYESWEREALATIQKHRFVAFSLHDCYGEYWLPHYRSLLEKVSQLGRLATLNEAANEKFLTHALELQQRSATVPAVE